MWAWLGWIGLGILETFSNLREFVILFLKCQKQLKVQACKAGRDGAWHKPPEVPLPALPQALGPGGAAAPAPPAAIPLSRLAIILLLLCSTAVHTLPPPPTPSSGPLPRRGGGPWSVPPPHLLPYGWQPGLPLGSHRS